METKKVTMKKLADGFEALRRLTETRLSSWGKTRETAKLYRAVLDEAAAYNAELERLRREYPDGGDEFECRVRSIVGGEVEVPAVSLGEGDFAGELPSPADVCALCGIVEFE